MTPSQGQGSGLGIGMGRKRDPNGQVTSHLVGKSASMTYLALTLVMETHQPVVDRTGLSGNFDFAMDFAPFNAGPNDSSGASIFTAIEEQLGLKLQPAKVPVEALVIDRAEKPTEN